MAGEQITTDGQIEWNGLLLGPGTPYDLISLKGWHGAPGARRISVDRPGRHGALPGELRATERVVEAEFAYGNFATRTAFVAARDALAAAVAWTENPMEQPLVIQVDGRATTVSARVINADIPTDAATYNGGEGTAAIQWAASDPRRYGLTLHQASTGMPSPVMSGLAFPLAFPLDFGPGLAGGALILSNEGNADVWPIWEVTGPVTGPMITCQETGDLLEFNPGFAILAGQTLRIDTDTGAVMLGAASRRSELWTAEWFTIPAGSSKEVRFGAASGSGTLTGFVRDAWMT